MASENTKRITIISNQNELEMQTKVVLAIDGLSLDSS